MSENPLQSFFKTVLEVSGCVQTHLYQLISFPNDKKRPTTRNEHSFPFSTLSSSSPSNAERKQSNPNPSDTALLRPIQPLLKKENAASPVTKEELGRATWTFLHTLAAQYPDKPTRQQKKDVKELCLDLNVYKIAYTKVAYLFLIRNIQDRIGTYRSLIANIAILSRMYPCKECADHFKEVLRANPVEAGSQSEFSQWLCHAHNVVNRSLGKLVFPCERVDARWGKLECEQRACDLQGGNNPWD